MNDSVKKWMGDRGRLLKGLPTARGLERLTELVLQNAALIDTRISAVEVVRDGFRGCVDGATKLLQEFDATAGNLKPCDTDKGGLSRLAVPCVAVLNPLTAQQDFGRSYWCMFLIVIVFFFFGRSRASAASIFLSAGRFAVLPL